MNCDEILMCFSVRRIILYTKNRFSIVQMFYRNTPKVWTAVTENSSYFFCFIFYLFFFNITNKEFISYSHINICIKQIKKIKKRTKKATKHVSQMKTLFKFLNRCNNSIICISQTKDVIKINLKFLIKNRTLSSVIIIWICWFVLLFNYTLKTLLISIIKNDYNARALGAY